MLPRESATWWWKLVIFALFILSEIIRFSDRDVNVFSSFPLCPRTLFYVTCTAKNTFTLMTSDSLNCGPQLAGWPCSWNGNWLAGWPVWLTQDKCLPLGWPNTAGLALHASALFQISSALEGTEAGTTTDERDRKEDKRKGRPCVRREYSFRKAKGGLKKINRFFPSPRPTPKCEQAGTEHLIWACHSVYVLIRKRMLIAYLWSWISEGQSVSRLGFQKGPRSPLTRAALSRWNLTISVFTLTLTLRKWFL